MTGLDWPIGVNVSHTMCRSIKTLGNFEPPATQDEIRASALQFVRKLSGYRKPAKVNEAIFNEAVDEIAAVTERMLFALEYRGEPRDREIEAQKARERFAQSRRSR